MRESMAYIWARRIHEGVRFLEEVEMKYGRAEINMVYKASYNLYGDYHEPLEGDSVFGIGIVNNEEM